MTRNAKILFFIGACAIGYYFYKKNMTKKEKVSDKKDTTPNTTTTTTPSVDEEMFIDDFERIVSSPEGMVGGGVKYKNKNNGKIYTSSFTQEGLTWFDDKGKKVFVNRRKRKDKDIMTESQLQLFEKAKSFSSVGGAYNPIAEERRKANLKEVMDTITKMGLTETYQKWKSEQPKELPRP